MPLSGMISATLAAAANALAAVVLLLFLLLAMNGYSESDARWGLGAFALLAFLAAIVAVSLAAFLFRVLLRRGFGTFGSGALSFLGGTLVGGALQFVSAFVGVGVAEFVRVNY